MFFGEQNEYHDWRIRMASGRPGEQSLRLELKSVGLGISLPRRGSSEGCVCGGTALLYIICHTVHLEVVPPTRSTSLHQDPQQASVLVTGQPVAGWGVPSITRVGFRCGFTFYRGINWARDMDLTMELPVLDRRRADYAGLGSSLESRGRRAKFEVGK